jgi:hypothetical protein
MEQDREVNLGLEQPMALKEVLAWALTFCQDYTLGLQECKILFFSPKIPSPRLEELRTLLNRQQLLHN